MDSKAVEQRLQAMLDEAVDRRDRVSKHVEHRDSPLPPDFAEQAVELENDETLTALMARLDAQIAEVRAALGRLAAGEYGCCERCGAQIDVRRLDALPASTRCVACAD
ncbi:MAG: TraR/DksA family transcriptional regulator [Pseudomonadales bacterium]|nr:TraR/DksA family transcriptional regulator [Pseudomonadales bacterium]MCP5182647.1 TraR/DksA family transcriptional regulator [Pseudomonadales bacterium]